MVDTTLSRFVAACRRRPRHATVLDVLAVLGVEGAEQERGALGDEKYVRLVEVKNRFDPGDLFPGRPLLRGQDPICCRVQVLPSGSSKRA